MAKSQLVVRSGFPFNYDQEKVSDETGLHCLDESLTNQSESNDADINVIVRRFGLTGAVPQGSRVPVFGDFSQVIDYRTALDAVIQAERSFMSMPADLRSRFGNDPQQFVEFCSNPDNLPELRKLGLATPEAPASQPAAPAAGVSAKASAPADGGKSGA